MLGVTVVSSQTRRVARATTQAPCSALGSVWVKRVAILAQAFNCSLSVMAAPRIGDRMAGPFPAEKTPEYSEEKPIQSWNFDQVSFKLLGIINVFSIEFQNVEDQNNELAIVRINGSSLKI